MAMSDSTTVTRQLFRHRLAAALFFDPLAEVANVGGGCFDLSGFPGELVEVEVGEAPQDFVLDLGGDARESFRSVFESGDEGSAGPADGSDVFGEAFEPVCDGVALGAEAASQAGVPGFESFELLFGGEFLAGHVLHNDTVPPSIPPWVGGAGALGEIRTPDSRIRSAVLYPLSYKGEPWGWPDSNRRSTP